MRAKSHSLVQSRPHPEGDAVSPRPPGSVATRTSPQTSACQTEPAPLPSPWGAMGSEHPRAAARAGPRTPAARRGPAPRRGAEGPRLARGGCGAGGTRDGGGATFCLRELPNGVGGGGSNQGTQKTRRRWVPRAPGREFGPLQAAASVWRPGPRFVGTQAISVLAKLTAPVRGRGTIRCKEKWGRNS